MYKAKKSAEDEKFADIKQKSQESGKTANIITGDT